MDYKTQNVADITSFTNLFEQRRPYLYATTLYYLGHQPDLDDVIQETYLTAFTKIHQLKKIDHINLWLYKILKNKCLSVLRKKDRINTVNQKSHFYKNALTDDITFSAEITD